MATKKKMLQAAAGQAGGAALDITDVFSTYLYTGTGSTQTITNGIDLAGEGGLVWMKNRDAATNHRLYTTDLYSGSNSNLLQTNLTTGGSNTGSFELESFNSDGFTLGFSGGAYSESNGANTDYASWTFRKAPKFFDVVAFSHTNGVSTTLSHNLGCEIGFAVAKRTDSTSDWPAQHRSVTGANTAGRLNSTLAFAGGNGASNFFENFNTTTVDVRSNQPTGTYVAYLFAHNNGDGGFGPDGDQDIIKCGSYSQSSASDVDVDLGFEPQFVIVKRSDDTSQWYILDEMRGFLAGSNSTSSRTLYASLANAEADFTIQKTATGFTWPSGQYGSGTQEYIYMAIRRGPLAQPESGTEVFDVQFNGGNDPSKAPVYQSGFVTDMSIVGLRTGGSVNYPYTGNRLMGIQTLETHNTDAEESGGASFQWDFMNGFIDGVPSVITDTQIAWMWKRAPSFCDVVAYSGSTSTQNISHNLGVQPEMIWIKNRSFSGTSWPVLFTSLGARKYLYLNTTDAAITLPLYNGTDFFANTLPTSSVFTVGGGTAGGGYDDVGSSGSNYIAYLFATVPGVSKVGSYTGNGSTQNIDCGFSSGARFVLIKCSSHGLSDWHVMDSTRGIVAGNDPFLYLNDTTAEDTGEDMIDPYSSGFALAANNRVNTSGSTYIFYAIA